MIGRATLPERVLFHWVSGLVLLKVLLTPSFSRLQRFSNM
jgi:hypothetical protein